MWGSICKPLLTVVIIAHICVRVVTNSIIYHCQCPSRIQFLVVRKQYWYCSKLQHSEQAIYADEQLHLCEEHGLSLLQLC